MNLNKIGNIICIATSLFLSVMGAAAMMALIAMAPDMLDNVASEYIVPFAAGQMMATFVFVFSEMMLVAGVVGQMSVKNRRMGLIELVAAGGFIGINGALFFVAINAIIGVGGDPFMLIMVSMSFYVALAVAFGYIVGSVLKILHRE